jgi:hypothetical protein
MLCSLHARDTDTDTNTDTDIHIHTQTHARKRDDSQRQHTQTPLPPSNPSHLCRAHAHQIVILSQQDRMSVGQNVQSRVHLKGEKRWSEKKQVGQKEKKASQKCAESSPPERKKTLVREEKKVGQKGKKGWSETKKVSQKCTESSPPASAVCLSTWPKYT